MVSGMDAPRIAMPTSLEIAPTGVVMSSAEYAVLTRELESLRASHRSDLAQRLHDVRAHGTTKYRLIGWRTSESPAHEVSLGSPVGKPLAGARTGDVVLVSLPNGRERSLTILGVSGVAHRFAKAA